MAVIKKKEEEEKGRLYERVRELENMVRIKEEEIRRIERIAEENITRHDDDMSTIASSSIFSSIFTLAVKIEKP